MDMFELIFSEGDSIDAVSIVEMPAIQEEALFLNTQREKINLSTDEDKREIVGAALVPNLPIYRKSGDKEYYIYFSADTVRKAMDSFTDPRKTRAFTLEHEKETAEVVQLESWIVEDAKTDKANTTYNLNAPEGSWILRSYVPSKEFWNNVIKAGNFSGYSIEGKFDKGRKVETDLSDDLLDSIVEKIENIVLDYNDNLELEEVKLESYGGYPDSAKSAARSAIEANKRNNNKCATNVGKIRARQIARGEKFTISTVKRIYSYLSRAGEYYDGSDQNACGTISYKLWGGKSMLSWSRKILRQTDNLKD
jgi:hypothetical protein